MMANGTWSFSGSLMEKVTNINHLSKKFGISRKNKISALKICSRRLNRFNTFFLDQTDNLTLSVSHGATSSSKAIPLNGMVSLISYKWSH